MHDLTNEKMTIECNRVRDLIAKVISEIEQDEGDIRLFGAAFLRAALEMHVELEGIKGIERVISRLAREQLQQSGMVGRA